MSDNGNGAIVQHEEQSLLNVIARAMSDERFDVNKLETLLRIQSELLAERARQSFYRSMSDAQGEMRAVLRDSSNEQTRSKYAKLEAIDEQIRPIYTNHGFSLTYGTAPPRDPGSIRVVCTCAHRDGHTEKYELEAPPDMTGARGTVNKSPLHGLGSTVTYLRRYLLVMAFNIMTAAEDDDGIAGGARENIQRPPQNGGGRKMPEVLDQLGKQLDDALTETDINMIAASPEAEYILKLPEAHKARMILTTAINGTKQRVKAFQEKSAADEVFPPGLQDKDMGATP